MTNLLTASAAGVRYKSLDALRVRRWPALLALALAVVFLIVGGKLIGVGAGDFGIVGLFSTDEQLAGQLVSNMLRAGNLGLSHFYSYGPLDLYASRALLWPYQLIGRVDERAIIIALRLVSLVAGAGCLLVAYALGSRLWYSWAGIAGAAMLLSSSTFLSWSTTAHPDMLQLLWLLLGIWSATILMSASSKKADLLWLLLGSVFAGLAFATKYSGELLLPVLWVTAVAARAGKTEARRWRTQLGRTILDIGLSLIVFMAVTALLEVDALREGRSFLYQMTLEAGLAHNGHLVRAVGDPSGWITVLASTEVLGPVGLIIGLIGLIAWTVTDARTFFSQRGAVRWTRLPLELFTLGYLFFLLLWVGDHQARYALPILPGIALAAGGVIVWLARHGRIWTVVAAVIFALTMIPLVQQTVDFARSQSARMSNPSVADRVAAGRWIAARWSGNAAVVADAYSYLPSSFVNVYQSFGLTHEILQTLRPEVVVTNSGIRDRFLDPSLAAEYVDGAVAYQEIATTYSDLESGRLACYALENRIGPVTIYSRNAGC